MLTFDVKKIILLLLFLSVQSFQLLAADSDTYIQIGWANLLKDNDTTALRNFESAYQSALAERNTLNAATALLNMGICSYGASYSQGLKYCMNALSEFKKLEQSNPQQALIGRSKCLQLISTIKSRQGKYRESIALSKEAQKGFPDKNDTSSYLGLIYNSLGIAYTQLNQLDSAEYFHRLALNERLLTHNWMYLPGSYLSVAEIELRRENKDLSYALYSKSLAIADSTGNRQAQVSAWIGLGKWHSHFEKNDIKAEANYQQAKEIARNLSDKSFYLNALNALLQLKKQQSHFAEALLVDEEIRILKDSLANWEKDKVTKSLEVQFEVAEKDRLLSLLQKEKDIAKLTNYLLYLGIASLLLIASGIILFLKKINARDKQLLTANESLLIAQEEQKKLKEQQLQNELEFKESQLSAMTLQMLQKNELMQELQEKVESDEKLQKNNSLTKLINKGLNHDKEWTDFNSHFESINKNFYTRLKQSYPDISPNDLRICALIKLNLTTKEMAGILNISPDSVKTARYRLRKKLQLNTEDNLTDFILNLK